MTRDALRCTPHAPRLTLSPRHCEESRTPVFDLIGGGTTRQSQRYTNINGTSENSKNNASNEINDINGNNANNEPNDIFYHCNLAVYHCNR